MRSKPVDHRPDIFSLGVMLYELATGGRPFTGDTPLSTITSILRDTPRPITDLNHELPRDLAVIVRRVPRIAEQQRNRVRVNGNAIELGRTNIATPLFRIQSTISATTTTCVPDQLCILDERARSGMGVPIAIR